jgi:hypothetical protein
MTASRVQFGGGAPRGRVAAAVCENAAAPSAALLRAPRFSEAPLLALATRCKEGKGGLHRACCCGDYELHGSK